MRALLQACRRAPASATCRRRRLAEAGPIGKLRDNDIIEIAVDRLTLMQQRELHRRRTAADAKRARELARRQTPDLHAHGLPAVPGCGRHCSRWAAASEGCICDTDKIIEVINAGKTLRHLIFF